MSAQKPPSSSADGTSKSRSSISLKSKAGDTANRWLEKNRNLVLRQTPVWAQSFAVILIGLGSLAVIGGIFFKIDEVVTASGQLKSVGGTIQVKTPAGGRVAEVLFKDGDHVEKGQLLVRFDTREAIDEKDTLLGLIKVEQEDLKSRLLTVKSQKATLDGRINVLEQKLSTKKLLIDGLSDLVDIGGFQKMQFLEQKDAYFGLLNEINEVEERIGQLALQEDTIRLSSRKNIDEMSNKLRKVNLQLLYKNVLAPISGVVFDPQAFPEGVIAAGEPILSIVSKRGLYAEVFVPNKDIGFIKMNQPTKIRIDAFPYSRYGELDGSVTYIGADALPPDQKANYYRFPINITLKQTILMNEDMKIPLQSGMSVTTNLKLREKPVISLVSDLLINQTDSIKSLRQQ